MKIVSLISFVIVSFIVHSVSSFSARSSLSLTMSATGDTPISTATRHQMFDMPVSNNGARCRIIIYKKNIPESEVKIVPPKEVGGLQSDEYLAINPQGKMPALFCPQTGLKLGESDTIARYLLTTYRDGPSFLLDHPLSNMIARHHDIYMQNIQGCMYKAAPPFGPFGTRSDALKEYCKQMQVIDDLTSATSSTGLYLLGDSVSLADATLFPSMVFAQHMLPKFGITPALPPRLEAWYQRVKTNDAVFARVEGEIKGALDSWDERNRWGPILGAGWRDDEPRTIFDKILSKEIPSAVVREDDKTLAFKDINPAAPAHVLVIPKERSALTRLRKATPEHVEILGRLMVAAAEISKDETLGFGNGARIVINDGPDGGQEVGHLHVHVLGGCKMTWPPGSSL